MKFVNLAHQDFVLPFRLDLDDTLSLDKVNSVGVLMGEGPDSLVLKEVLTQDFVAKCRQETQIDNRKNNPETYSDRALCKMMLELLLYFQQCQPTDLYQYIREEVDACMVASRNTVLMRHLATADTKSLKVCPHCGKQEGSKFIKSFGKHKNECALEHMSCDCSDLSFKTPAEKRRHMLLVHSGQEFFTCPHCPYFKKNKATVDRHVLTIHGSADQRRDQKCDLCSKSFKSPYHLSVHRFNHELRYCEVCNIEILGRIPHKNHMMKKHSMGFDCRVCGKKIFTERELETHHRKEHDSVWKL